MKSRLFTLFSLLLLIAWSSCKHDPIGPIDSGLPPETYYCETPAFTSFTNDCNSDSVYYNQVAVLLNASCGSSAIACHITANDDNSDVDLSSYAGILNSDIVDTNDPSGSEIVEVISDNEMPPSDAHIVLSNDYINELESMLTSWISQGALNNECISDCDTTEISSFENDIYPIIYYNCVSCHWDQSLSGSVCLTSYENIKAYALNGKLVNSITGQNDVEPMPYASSPIPQCDIDLITNWVNNGAPQN